MAKPNDGGQVFPQKGEIFSDGPNDPLQICMKDGMTKREWYAGQALAGLIANPERSGEIAEFTRDAANFADAMIARPVQD